MAKIPQLLLFSWKEIEELGDVSRLKLLIDHLPDEKLMQQLESARGMAVMITLFERCGTRFWPGSCSSTVRWNRYAGNFPGMDNCGWSVGLIRAVATDRFLPPAKRFCLLNSVFCLLLEVRQRRILLSKPNWTSFG